MKTFFLCFLVLALGCNTSPKSDTGKLVAATCEGRGCSGSEYCSACKNCSGCKHCAKEGGTCGICAPTSGPAKVSPKKKNKSKRN